ncbi:MAG: prolipoprotein diacylglyceryl transferase [Anaerolineae bacterium]
MHPVLFSIDGLTITSYSALLHLGLIAAAAATLIQSRRIALPALAAIDAMLAAIAGGAIGARLLYVAIHWAYFVDHLDEAWRIWQGGLSWHGGLIGGAIGVWLIARTRFSQSPAAWLDLLAPGAALGTAFGWIGCFLSACAFGREVFPGEPLFGIAIDAPDVYGRLAPRLPSQLFGAGWGLLVFAVLWSLSGSPTARTRLGLPLPDKRRETPARTRALSLPKGMRFALFVALYSAGSLLIGFSRADATAWIGGLSVEQVMDAMLLVVGAGGLLILSSRKRRARDLFHNTGENHVD